MGTVRVVTKRQGGISRPSGKGEGQSGDGKPAREAKSCMRR
jgi:hypothetical protein